MKMKIDDDDDDDDDGPNLGFSRLKMPQIFSSPRTPRQVVCIKTRKKFLVCLLHCCVDLHVFTLEKPCTHNSADSQLSTVAEDIRTG